LQETPPFGVTLPEEILVPFPVESPLSGIRKLPPSFTMWYRRMLPAAHECGNDRSTLLHFEAVDWNTTVFVNGEENGLFFLNFTNELPRQTLDA